MKEIGLKRRRFSLVDIYHEIIYEAFDFKNIKPYKLKPNIEGWEFNAVIGGEKIKVYIYFERVDFSRVKVKPKLENEFDLKSIIFYFGFEIGDIRDSSQYKKTSYQDYIKILATVGDALIKLINKYNPSMITFFSQSKHGGNDVDIQKDNIYFKALDQNIPQGYTLDTLKDVVNGKIGLMIYKGN